MLYKCKMHYSLFSYAAIPDSSGAEAVQSPIYGFYKRAVALDPYVCRMRNSDLYAYVELLLKWNKLTCTFGSGMAYTHINQIEGTTLNRWNYRPTAKFLYPLSKVASLRFSYKLRNQLPSLSELSAVEQQVDSLRILKGNPLLHTYLTHSFSLDYDLNVPNCNMGVSLLYELRNHPVMEQTVFDASKQLFVRSYDNQKRFEKMDASLYANISLWKDHVMLWRKNSCTYRQSVKAFLSVAR